MDEDDVLNGNENYISIDDLLDAIGDEAYNSIAYSYYEVSEEIDSVLLEINPDLTEADLAYATMVFTDDLEFYDHFELDEDDELDLDEEDEFSI